MTFDDRITEHDRLATWRGALIRPTFVGFARNALCGDEIWLDLEIVQNSVRQARFHGQGCVDSQACASMLCEGIEGKSVHEVLASTADQVMEFAIRELTINRQRCALTAWDALLQALNGIVKHRKSAGLPCSCNDDEVLKTQQPVEEPPQLVGEPRSGGDWLAGPLVHALALRACRSSLPRSP
jgi:nitrogen fixation protein NifU and related proteins